VHLPAYLADRGLSAQVGGWTLATIGLFNIFGSITYGWLSERMPKRYLLSFNYFVRAAAIFAFISFPVTPVTALLFGAVMGLVWLSVVPPTNGIITVMFGTRWLGTLAGFAFLSHQIGGFLGAWLGGVVFEHSGSYEPVWWLAILLGILSGLIKHADRGEAGGATRPGAGLVSDTPIVLFVGAGALAILSATAWLWAHYGATLFFEIMRAGFAACFG